MTGSEPQWINYRFRNITSNKRITLPGNLIKDFGLEGGDTTKLELVDSAEPPYIRGIKEENGKTTEGYYTLSEDCRVSLPARMRDPFTKPYHQAAVEVNLIGEPHYRIYDLLDFIFNRLPEIRKQDYCPNQGDAVKVEDYSRPINLASSTPYPGQKCKIVPVKPDFDPLIKEAKTEDRNKVLVTSDDIVSVTKDYSFPSKNATELGVRWQPEVTSSEETEKLQTDVVSSQPKVRFTGLDFEEKEVIIPKKGGVKFWIKSSQAFGNNWIVYTGDEFEGDSVRYGNMIDSEWGSKYFDVSKSDDSCFHLYFPTPFVKKGNPDIWWS